MRNIDTTQDISKLTKKDAAKVKETLQEETIRISRRIIEFFIEEEMSIMEMEAVMEFMNNQLKEQGQRMSVKKLTEEMLNTK